MTIGDPGPERVLDAAVYFRGAMTLHALRGEIGDRDFFRLLRRWTQGRAGDNVSIEEFIALAERVSGEQLGAFFDTWLFTPEKPPGIEPPGLTSSALEGLASEAWLHRNERSTRASARAARRPRS